MVSNPFYPLTSGPPGQTIPIKLIPLDNRSPWKNGPPKFGPPGQIVPNQFGPHISGSPEQTKYSSDHLSSRTKFVGDHFLREPNWLGAFVWGLNFWDPFVNGLNWLGTVCPEGPINWEPNVLGLNVRGPNLSQPKQGTISQTMEHYCTLASVLSIFHLSSL